MIDFQQPYVITVSEGGSMNYQYTRYTPIDKIRKGLKSARREQKIYVIARIVQVLRERGERAALKCREKRQLCRALAQARRSRRLPLAQWIPRGYQIARFIYLIRHLAPECSCAPTARDTRLIKAAARKIKREGRLWGKDQLQSLILTARAIGLEVE